MAVSLKRSPRPRTAQAGGKQDLAFAGIAEYYRVAGGCGFLDPFRVEIEAKNEDFSCASSRPSSARCGRSHRR